MEIDCVTLNIASQHGAAIEVEIDTGEDGTAKAPGRWCLRRLRSCWEGISDIVPEEHDPYNTSLFNKTAMFHTDTTEQDILEHDWCVQLFGKIYTVTKAFVYNLLSMFLAPFLACFWGIIFACIAFWGIWVVCPLWRFMVRCIESCEQRTQVLLQLLEPFQQLCDLGRYCRITCQRLLLGPRLQTMVKIV